MNTLKFFLTHKDIIYPEFFTLANKDGDTLVFLKEYGQVYDAICDSTSNTNSEAMSTHYHLFDNCKKSNIVQRIELAKIIARNLKTQLMLRYPEKSFVVYMTAGESIIIRFHQIWTHEELFYDKDEWYDSDGTELFVF